MLSSSLKSNLEIFHFPPQIVPNPTVWSNYPNALNYIPFWRYAFNTFVISASSVVGTLVSCPIALYSASSSSERVSFRQINKKTGNRLRQ